MLDILDDYLSDAASPELKESIRAAHELFDRYGLETYEQGFEEILLTDDQVDTGKTLHDIYDLTRSLQFKILEEHQLVIDEDAPPSILNVFLDGLKRLENYDNPDAVYGILTQPNDTAELIADCVALVTGQDATRLHRYVMNCGQALLQAIVRQLDQTHFAQSDEEIVSKRERVERYKRFITVADIKQLKVAYLLEHGMDVGHPLMVYLNIIGNDFEEMEAKYIANELVAMCMISSDASDNPRAAITAHLEQYVSDMDKITKIDVAVGDLLLKLAAAHG